MKKQNQINEFILQDEERRRDGSSFPSMGIQSVAVISDGVTIIIAKRKCVDFADTDSKE